MKYTVSIDEKKRSITVTLADGTQGVSHCAPTDNFNISTGIELALERAKVAKANTAKTSTITKTDKPMSVMELVKALEAALPEGEMVIVGNGSKMTEAQKKWLRSLIGEGCSCNGSCNCKCGEDDDAAYDEGYDDGYNDGVADKTIDCRELEANYEALEADFASLEADYDILKDEHVDLEDKCDNYEALVKDLIRALEVYGQL